MIGEGAMNLQVFQSKIMPKLPANEQEMHGPSQDSN